MKIMLEIKERIIYHFYTWFGTDKYVSSRNPWLFCGKWYADDLTAGPWKYKIQAEEHLISLDPSQTV